MPTKPGSRADKQKGRQDLSYRPSCLVIGKDYFLAAAFLAGAFLAAVVVFFFAAAIVSYVVHGFRRDTTNQFQHVDTKIRLAMAALIIGEVGGFAVLLAGFIVGQFG